MIDVLVAGAGPAGSLAALLFARAGARVLIVDRERFPRDVVCAGIVSPTTQGLLSSLELDGTPLAHAPIVRDVSIMTRRTRLSAPDALAHGRVVARRDLDAWLLDRAIHAGARFEPGVAVAAPLVDATHRGGLVRGAVLTSSAGVQTRMPATLVIAADGARSTLAAALGVRHESSRRRWAAVVQVSTVDVEPDRLDVHVQSHSRLVVAPLADRRRVLCLVTARDLSSVAPLDAMRAAIVSDKRAARSLASASFDDDARAIAYPSARVRAAGVPGALFVGDAAGAGDAPLFDGLSRAIAGAQLAVTHGLRALETGDFDSAIGRLADDRRRAIDRASFSDRVGRAVGSTPGMIDVASALARVVPAIERVVVRGAWRG
jgi:flavin-dependent dehydrogenase